MNNLVIDDIYERAPQIAKSIKKQNKKQLDKEIRKNYGRNPKYRHVEYAWEKIIERWL